MCVCVCVYIYIYIALKRTAVFIQAHGRFFLFVFCVPDSNGLTSCHRPTNKSEFRLDTTSLPLPGPLKSFNIL